jgi:hypothetical protein
MLARTCWVHFAGRQNTARLCRKAQNGTGAHSQLMCGGQSGLSRAARLTPRPLANSGPDELGPSRPLLSTRNRARNLIKPQKSRRVTRAFASQSGRPPPRNGSVGTKVKSIDFTRRFDTQRLPPKKTARMGDKAKPLASLGRRLCCV